MDWKQRNSTYKTVLDVVTSRSGMSENELLHPETVPPGSIQNLSLAAETIQKAIQEKAHISVMGDYDADGITSCTILYFLLKKLGANPYIRFPRRMSEGYGLKPSTVAEFDTGLLITVDNGIAAVEAIDAAKQKGLTVVVLDHHLPGETLPCADVIVDPHLKPEENGYVEYCGAGLSYKLAELFFPKDMAFLRMVRSIAAIGTIADSVPLTGDNRYIVKEGLAELNKRGTLIPGLYALLDAAEVFDIDEYDIAFKIAPMLNAAGRLKDDGAMLSFRTLSASGSKDAVPLANQLKAINEQRKDLTASTEAYIEEIITEECLFSDVPLCIFAENIPEGIVGIITGKLAEKYKVPTFVLTTTETPGILKGSGRTYGDYNLMKLVNAAMPHLMAGGGHAGAAGITVAQSNYAAMANAMYEAANDYIAADSAELEYDLRIDADEIASHYKDVKKYAPYGQGNPRPIFLINDVVLSPRLGKTAKYMGKQYEHVKLHSKNFSAICFGKSEEYKRLGCPIQMDFIGELSMNVFRYSSELQIEAADFREHKRTMAGAPSSLMEALRLNGTI